MLEINPPTGGRWARFPPQIPFTVSFLNRSPMHIAFAPAFPNEEHSTQEEYVPWRLVIIAVSRFCVMSIIAVIYPGTASFERETDERSNLFHIQSRISPGGADEAVFVFLYTSFLTDTPPSYLGFRSSRFYL